MTETSQEAPIIDMRGVCFNYPSGPSILNDLDFELFRGERVGLVAPNGSGKTTLFHIIMGLLKPCAGEVRIFGRTVHREQDFIEVRQRIGMLFQDADDQLFSPTVLEDVAFGPLNLGKSREEAAAIARRTLARLGLEGFENRVTFRLSGGEKRLVSLATVLAMQPEVLLLDEPTSGLDDDATRRVTEILARLPQAMLIVSHNHTLLDTLATTSLHLANGRLHPTGS